MPAIAKQIEAKLTEALQPARLQILDESSQHQGHAGWREGGETHFYVRIVSPDFRGKSRVARQRAVYAVLAQEMAAQIHALRLETLTPEEAAAQKPAE